jgi:hemerythrin-like domain-containing protein
MIKPEALFKPVLERSSLDRPLDHLMACHRRIEERLEVMERAAAHLGDLRAEALAAFASAFQFLDTSGVLHTADEEESLFPRLRPLLERGERTYLAGLEHDHTEAHRMYTELKGLIAAPAEEQGWIQNVRGLVERLSAHYRRHIASEDETLQNYASGLLGAEALTEIAAEMRARRK